MAYDTERSEEDNRQLNERKTSPMLDVALQLWLLHLTTDETFGIKDCVGRVRVERIFGRITDSRFEVRVKAKGQSTRKRTHSRSSSVKATQDGVIRWP